MKTSELIKMLKEAGYRLTNHCTKHDEWYNPNTGKHIMIPRHGPKEVPTGTANRILKDAGLK